MIFSASDFFNKNISTMSRSNIIFLSVAIGVFLIALIVKNIFLRMVLKKKA
jgi:hypothetical protein